MKHHELEMTRNMLYFREHITHKYTHDDYYEKAAFVDVNSLYKPKSQQFSFCKLSSTKNKERQ